LLNIRTEQLFSTATRTDNLLIILVGRQYHMINIASALSKHGSVVTEMFWNGF